MVHDLSGRGHHLSITAEPRWNCVVFLRITQQVSFWLAASLLAMCSISAPGKCMASVWQRLRLPGVP